MEFERLVFRVMACQVAKKSFCHTPKITAYAFLIFFYEMRYLKCEIHVQVTPEESPSSFILQKLLSCGISPTLARNKNNFTLFGFGMKPKQRW